VLKACRQGVSSYTHNRGSAARAWPTGHWLADKRTEAAKRFALCTGLPAEVRRSRYGVHGHEWRQQQQHVTTRHLTLVLAAPRALLWVTHYALNTHSQRAGHRQYDCMPAKASRSCCVCCVSHNAHVPVILGLVVMTAVHLQTMHACFALPVQIELYRAGLLVGKLGPPLAS